jgi:hypothetical protein
LVALDANAFGVQHHPEAGPGPHDAAYLFERFAERMRPSEERGGWVMSGGVRGLPQPELGVG